MQILETISLKLKLLPDDKQVEVADFIDFLLSRLYEEPDAEQILDETSGIWAGELDGVAYEDQMRQQWERRN